MNLQLFEHHIESSQRWEITTLREVAMTFAVNFYGISEGILNLSRYLNEMILFRLICLFTLIASGDRKPNHQSGRYRHIAIPT